MLVRALLVYALATIFGLVEGRSQEYLGMPLGSAGAYCVA